MYWYRRRIIENRHPAAIAAVGFVAVILAAALAGCEDQTHEPQTAAQASPEAIAAKIRPALAPLFQMLGQPALDNGNVVFVDHDVCAQITGQIDRAKTEFAKTDAGEAALDRIAGELRDLIRQARAEDRWGLVLCAIDAYERLRPGTHLMRLLRNRAMVHAMRPHVVVKGFFDDNERDELYVFLEVTVCREYPVPPEPTGEDGDDDDEERAQPRNLETTGKTHMVQVRVKEEFLGLRLVDVVGNKRGVVLEYLADPGHYFTIMMPPRKFGLNRRPVAGAS